MWAAIAKSWSTRSRKRQLASMVTAVALATPITLAGCGGDGGGGPKPHMPPPAAAAAEEEEADPTVDEYTTLGVNPKWVPLQSMFDAYKTQKIENLANPLLTNHVVFVEPPPLPERKSAESEIPVSPLERGGFDRNKDKDKRTVAPLESYKLVMLMTGTANPKAVVIGPQGRRFILKRNDPLGSEKGRIRAILQYKMLVSVPNEAKARTVSIEPPLAKIASGVFAPDDL